MALRKTGVFWLFAGSLLALGSVYSPRTHPLKTDFTQKPHFFPYQAYAKTIEAYQNEGNCTNHAGPLNVVPIQNLSVPLGCLSCPGRVKPPRK